MNLLYKYFILAKCPADVSAQPLLFRRQNLATILLTGLPQPLYADDSHFVLLSVTVQPAELLRHPAIENRFAMGRMPTGSAFSYGLCNECTDLAEL